MFIYKLYSAKYIYTCMHVHVVLQHAVSGGVVVSRLR